MKTDCYFCENPDTKYCPVCDKYLCDNCRKDYKKRTAEALKLGIDRLRGILKR